jgi:proteic killer suppression protein
VIQSFGDKETARFAEGQFVRAFQGFADQASKRLDILDAAENLGDLAALPSNRLEALRGDLAGLFSIRINAQWRLVFRWLPADAGPFEVRIIDYH